MTKTTADLVRRVPVRIFLALLLFSLTGGCLSRESLDRDLRLSRSRAYRTWRHARAQRQSEVFLTGKLSLQDALKLALTYNKSLQAALQEKDVSQGRVTESYSEALPKVSAVGTYTRLDEDVNLRNNYSADLEVRQPVFRGGAISAALRAARVFSCLTDEVVRGVVQTMIHAVAKDYYEMLLAQHLYAVNKDAVKSSERHLADVKQKRASGVASQFDVLRAEVDVSNFRAEMIRQQNRIHLAKARLFKTMGVSQECDVTLSDELTYEPMKPVLEAAVKLAYENRPDLYQAELNVRLQAEALRIARSRYWPQVSVFFSQGWARPDPRALTRNRWGDASAIGATAEWTLFDGLGREGRVMQEKATLKERNIELLDAQEHALLEVQQAILSLQDAEEFVESQKLNLERAAEAFRLAEVGYRQGVNTEVEVIDARAALTLARGLHYQAIHAHVVARLELQRSTGILGPRAGVAAVPAEVPMRPAHIEAFAEP